MYLKYCPSTDKEEMCFQHHFQQPAQTFGIRRMDIYIAGGNLIAQAVKRLLYSHITAANHLSKSFNLFLCIIYTFLWCIADLATQRYIFSLVEAGPP